MQILYNAKIHTLNPQQPTASIIVIDDHAPHGGRVLALGDDPQLLDQFGSRVHKQDMGGAVILPGLTDAHLHLRYYAHGLQKVDLFNVSQQTCLERVAARAAETPPSKWILGHGWNQNNWPEGFPSATDLDAIAPNHPVYLTATSLHAAWANSAALQAAGVTANTPNPKNGEFQRDASGQPTGILFESAMAIVSDAIPQPTPDEDDAAILAAQNAMWQLGLTGVHDFDRVRSFQALQRVHTAGKLKLRVIKNLPVERLDEILYTGLRSGFGDDLLRIGGIKAFADGALGPRTAAMLQSYEGEPDNRGMLFMDGEELYEHAQKAAQGGLSMTVHAIGDQANHETLNAFAQLRTYEQANHLPALRHRLEHAQVLHSDDLARFKKLAIIASMQPIHATSDMLMADKYWGERAQYSYAWQTLLDQGARLAFGSDAPVDSANPFWGIHAAVTRQRGDGAPGPNGWYPDQRLSVTTALQGYTSGPAYAAGMEDRLGQLAPGYLADLIALEQDPLTCPSAQLRELRPIATMVGGDWVWTA